MAKKTKKKQNKKQDKKFSFVIDTKVINKNGRLYNFSDECIEQINNQLQEKIKDGKAVVHVVESNLNPFYVPIFDDATGIIKESSIKEDGIYAKIEFLKNVSKSILNDKGKPVIKNFIFAPRAKSFEIDEDTNTVKSMNDLLSIDLILNEPVNFKKNNNGK